MAKNTPGDVVYFLKGGVLYDIYYSGAYARPIAPEDAGKAGKKYSILIDDTYFYYIRVGKLTVSKKKLKNVISNYLQSLIPMELFSGFAVFENNGVYSALLYKSDLNEILESHPALFKSAAALTTCFCELDARYSEFAFTDGVRAYEKKGDTLEALGFVPEDVLRVEELWDDIYPLRTRVKFDKIKPAATGINAYKLPTLVLAVCYLLFVSGLLVKYYGEKKLYSAYEARLNELYVQAGVADNPDPYGILLSKANVSSGPNRAGGILEALTNSLPDGVTVDSLYIADRNVKITGTASDFAGVDEFKNKIEKNTGKKVTVESSSQAESEDIVKFALRYEP